MTHRKVLLPEDLDELEQHIRDHVQEMTDQGIGEQEAFRRATQSLAGDQGTAAAYRRVYWGKLRRKGLLKSSIASEVAMVRSQAMVALRSLRRHPGYTVLNVAGLSVGIACCLLILLFVRDERSFDRFNEHADRIVRVTLRIPDGREIEVTPTIVGPLLTREFPQVERAVRIYDIGRFREVTVGHGDRSWQESGFMFADSTVFDIFTFPFVEGNPREALQRPGTLVLTRDTAVKYFGQATNVLGRTLQIGSYGSFEVTGVMENVPSASHLQFDLLGSFSTTHWALEEIWDSANFLTYLMLTAPDGLASLDAGVRALVAMAQEQESVRQGFSFGFQRLTDIYLVHQGRQRYVWIFAALALLILSAACINYINLSTARSARRAREVGVRKALGAHRGQVMRQFFGESALMSTLAMVVGVFLAMILLPYFNQVSGKELDLAAFSSPSILALLAGLLALTTLGAGVYPAMLLARFQPAIVLKGLQTGLGSGGRLRKALVVGQFAVTVFLLVGTWAVMNQLQFIRSGDLGFDRDHVAVISLANSEATRALPALKTALQSNPAVLSVAATNAIPGKQLGGYSLRTVAQEGEPPPVSATPVDPDIVETLGLDLVAGPGFSRNGDLLAGPDSARYEYVVNEDLVRLAGWTSQTAIGQRMSVSGSRREGEVVGVIRNYNFLPVTEEMRPLALFVEPSWHVLLVKIGSRSVPETMEAIRTSWQQVTGNSPFVYDFLDQEYSALYQSEARLARVLGASANLAIFIACLGLFGLASYTAEQRTREIGIRKALGASVPGLVALLNREFSLLVVGGFMLGAPAAWVVMSRWLEGYAYRAPLNLWAVLAVGLAVLLSAWLTAGWQSWRAARTSPADALSR